MTVEQLIAAADFKALCLPEPEREIKGAYMGDLLSWVMGKAGEGSVWLTIMSNINVVAVASLSDVACVLLTEGVTLESDVLKTAQQKGINILSTDLPSFEAAVKIHGMV